MKPLPEDSNDRVSAKQLTLRWVNCLPNSKESVVITGNNGICIQHFKNTDYTIDAAGRKRLKKGVIPSVFAMSNPRSEAEMQKSKRTSLNDKDDLLLQKIMKISAEEHQIEQDNKKIGTFSTLCDFLKQINDTDLTITLKSNFAHICIINFDCSIIQSFLKINSDLTFNASFDHKLPAAKISDINQLENLIENLKSSNSVRFFKSKITTLLDKVCQKNENLKDMIADQIQNLDICENLRRYSPSAMLIYMKIFLYSPKIYRYLCKNTLIMPTDRHLRRYLSNLPSDVCSLEENKKYLSYKFENLRTHEKLFVLMIDEIHIRATVDSHFSYGTFGFDHQDPQF